MARSQLDSAALDPALTYEAFRTGLTYRDVYHLIWDRKWKRRRGVLGAWRELKLQLWAEYQDRLEVQERENRRRRKRAA